MEETPTDARTRERAIVAALAARGLTSLSGAARAAGLDVTTLAKVVRMGLAPNPRVKTIEGLEKIGILDLVARTPALPRLPFVRAEAAG